MDELIVNASTSLSKGHPSEERDAAGILARRSQWMQFIRRWMVFIVGMNVLLVGIVMIVTPGPALVVIPLGLGILATEFVWARRILLALRSRLQKKSAAPEPRSH